MNEIEEMAKEIQKSVDGCAEYWATLIAKHLIEQGYRQVKSKVVLTKEEWKQIKNSLYYSREALERKLEKARKETAKEIIEMLVPPCEICDENWHKGCLCFRATIAEKIAKKYGVKL